MIIETLRSPDPSVRSSAALRLMIIVDEDATIDHKPVYTEIVRRSRETRLAGASIFRGMGVVLAPDEVDVTAPLPEALHS